MPRVVDKNPTPRGAGINSDYSPLAKLLDFQSPMDNTIKTAGNTLLLILQSGLGQLFGVISSVTGIDLTPLLTLVDGVLGATTTDPATGETTTGIDLSQYTSQFSGISPAMLLSLVSSISGVIGIGNLGTVLPQLMSALEGIDLSDPGSVLAAIEAAVADVGTDFAALVAAFVPGHSGGTETDFDTIIGNVTSLLGSPAGLLSGTFNPVTAAESMVSDVLGPTGMLALLTGGLANAANIPGLDASKIVSGTLLQSLIPSLTSGWGGSIASSLLSGTLLQSLIPSLTSGWGGTVNSGLLSGVLSGGLIPNLDASKITTGTLGSGLIPSLAASIITSGTFNQAQIPSLGSGWGGTILSSFLSGSIASGLIPNLDASKIVSGLLSVAQIPSLAASQITSGTFGAGLIPALDASKITTGTFVQTLIPSLTSGWGNTVSSSLLSGALAQALIPSLTSGWGGSIASNLLSGTLGSGLIPSLDASKITTGTLAEALIPALDGSWGKTIAGAIVSGALSNATLAGSAITSLLAAGNVPTLDASKITTGTFGAGLIPSLPSGWGGTIDNSLVLGVLGAQNIGVVVGSVVDNAVQGMTGTTGNGFSLGQLGNAASQLLSLGNSAQTIAADTSMKLANQAVTKASWAGPDLTADATFDIKQISGSSPTFVNLTQSQSVIGNITTPGGGVKKSISFWGQNTTNITSFVANLYKVDGSTGAATWLYSTGNIIGSIPNTLTKNPVNLPAANYINPASPGDWYAVEFQVLGPGTYQVVGLPSHWMPAEPLGSGIFPQQIGATRNPTTPSFLSVAAGNTGAGTSKSISWTHTIETAANTNGAILVGVNVSASTTGMGVAATCNGVAMTQVAFVTYNTTTVTSQLLIYGMLNPPSGTKTIVVTATGGGTNELAANSCTYANVGGFGTGVNTSATTGTALSETVSGVANDVVFQIFGSHTTSTTAISAYNKNSRWNQPFVANVNWATLIGDTTDGAASETFTATNPASIAWGSAAVPLLGVIQAAPSTIAAPGLPGSSNIPWIGLSGTVGPIQYAPVTLEYTTSGTHSGYALPSWFRLGIDYLDVIVLGGGGGGGGGASGPGFNGSNTTATVIDATGTHTLTGTGGAAASGGFNNVPASANAAGPGNYTWPTVNGTLYVGGGNVWVAPGSPPGGGGGGATWSGLYGFGASPGQWNAATYQPTSATISTTVGAGGAGSGGGTPGWPGADGATWFVARRNTAV